MVANLPRVNHCRKGGNWWRHVRSCVFGSERGQRRSLRGRAGAPRTPRPGPQSPPPLPPPRQPRSGPRRPPMRWPPAAAEAVAADVVPPGPDSDCRGSTRPRPLVRRGRALGRGLVRRGRSLGHDLVRRGRSLDARQFRTYQRSVFYVVSPQSARFFTLRGRLLTILHAMYLVSKKVALN